jgi:hypothetical protein
MNREIVPVKLQVILGVFGDNLKAIIFRNTQSFNHGVVHNLANLLAVFRSLAFEQIDSYKWHEILLE